MEHNTKIDRTASPVSLKDGIHSDLDIDQDDIEKQSVHDNNISNTAENEGRPNEPHIVDWQTPLDPENPMNWSPLRKIAAITIVSLITLLSNVLLAALMKLD
jgi:hypothetical protein